MATTDLVLALFIFLLLAYTIYGQFIIPHRNGITLLIASLLPRSRVDNAIFLDLVAIFIYDNIISHGVQFTTRLLCALVLVGLYLLWTRTPKVIFKQKGFLFVSVRIEYNRVKEINLFEDSVLAI